MRHGNATPHGDVPRHGDATPHGDATRRGDATPHGDAPRRIAANPAWLCNSAWRWHLASPCDPA